MFRGLRKICDSHRLEDDRLITSEVAVITALDAYEQVQARSDSRLFSARTRTAREELSAANSRFWLPYNKEFQDANEELRATNEELMLTQEELQPQTKSLKLLTKSYRPPTS